MAPFPVSLLPLMYFLFLTSWLPGYGFNHQGSPRNVVLKRVTLEFWRWKLKEFPEMATLEGFHEYDDKLESFSYGNFITRVTFCRHLLSQLEAINQTALSWTDRLTYEVLRDQFESFIQGYKWRDYGNLNPLNFMEGIHRSYGWIRYQRFESVSDFEKYMQRLSGITNQIEEIVALLERALINHRTNHAVSMRGVVQELEVLSNLDTDSSPFYSPFLHDLDKLNIEHSQKMSIKHQGRQIIHGIVQQSFRRLKLYIETRYMPFTRKEVGVGSMANGEDYYRNALQWHLSVNITPEEVHDIGLTEVSRIKIEMEKLMRWLDFDGNLKDFFTHLRTKREFFDHDVLSFVEKFRSAIYNRIKPRLPVLFANISTIPNVTVVPTSQSDIVAQYAKGSMYINIDDIRSRANFTILTLCLHETFPGHHLQISYARNQPLPYFRRYLWHNGRHAVPFHFPQYSAYVEGWALYAEFLGEELALFDKPYELFGRYTYEIFRAGRLVVDTGMHVMGWSRGQAIEFLSNHTFMTTTQIETEVDRYITWPGQACAYKIGELKIKELRTRAMNKLGWRYSPHEFHRHILDIGPVPLRLLEEHIDRWIERNIPSVAHSKQMDAFNFAVVVLLIFYRALLLTL